MILKRLRTFRLNLTLRNVRMKTLIGLCLSGRMFVSMANLLSLFILTSFLSADDNARGNLKYKGPKSDFEIKFKYAYFVSGPDAFDSGKTIRRLIFTASDISDKLKACENLRCGDRYMDGIQFDLDAGRRVLYWMSLDKQLVQYSGTVEKEALKLTNDTADKIAGKLVVNDSAAGGPAVEVEFDAPILKAYKKYD